APGRAGGRAWLAGRAGGARPGGGGPAAARPGRVGRAVGAPARRTAARPPRARGRAPLRSRRAALPPQRPPVRPALRAPPRPQRTRSEEHTSELQSLTNIVCRLLLDTQTDHALLLQRAPDHLHHTGTPPVPPLFPPRPHTP